ncbi:MAG: hypothetical protein KJ847_01855, partial [Firmicutes bacterium]|nr:hypothetical protein [Bacillota bacterium]
MVTIDDVKLDSVAGRVNIFDDGFIHVGDYVSFGDSSVLIHGSDFNVEFLEGNRYVDVNSDEDDFFSVSPRNGGMISITNRDDLSLEVVVSGSDGFSEWAKVSNGKFDMSVGSDGLGLSAFESLQGEFGSVPIDLKIVDASGNSMIVGADGEAGKVVINNDNDLSFAAFDAVVDANGDVSCLVNDNVITGNIVDYETIVRACAYFQAKKAVNYYNNEHTRLISELESTFGKGTEYNIKFVNISDWTNDQIYYVLTNLNYLIDFSSNLVYPIQKIMFYTTKNLNDRALGFASNIENSININEHGVKRDSFDIFPHEAAHIYHYNINYFNLDDFENEWYSVTDDGDAFKGRGMYTDSRELWAYMDEPVVEYNLRTVGWIREYSSKNIREDVATLVGLIAKDYVLLEKYGFADSFISNERLAKKLMLLCEYGFMSIDGAICNHVKEALDS